VAGEYIITYSATTGNGNPGQLTRSVVVVDPTVVVADTNLDLDYAPQTDEFGVAAPAGFTCFCMVIWSAIFMAALRSLTRPALAAV